MDSQDSSFLRQLARLTAVHGTLDTSNGAKGSISEVSPLKQGAKRSKDLFRAQPLAGTGGGSRRTAEAGPEGRGSRESNRLGFNPPAWIPSGKARAPSQPSSMQSSGVASSSSRHQSELAPGNAQRMKAGKRRSQSDADAYHLKSRAVRDAEREFERTLTSVRQGSLLHPPGHATSGASAVGRHDASGASAQMQSMVVSPAVPNGHAAVLDAFQEQVHRTAAQKAEESKK